MTRALRGTAIVDGVAEGPAMVSGESLAFSLVDPATGIVRQPGHPWNGMSVAGKVLFFPSGKGSSSGSYWLLNLAHEGKAPAAIVNTQTDAVIVAGAVLAGIPLVQRVDPDPLALVESGDAVRVREGGVIEVAARAAADATRSERSANEERGERIEHNDRVGRAMSLTPHQRAMLDGRHGWPQQLGMQLLTAVARAVDADALIPVSSVHLSLSGVSVGAPGLRLFEQLVARGGQFVVPTTLNVLSADRRSIGRMPSLHGKEQMQLGILDACQRMGALTTCSCNPFLLGFNPAFGESVAWNESASAPYVNAVLGARTNREGATALASALTGYTVAYGMHSDANRQGSVVVEVDAAVQGSDAFAVLGGAIARACGSRIPVIDGIASRPTLDEFTAFCASFATVGPLANFHIVGITPEAPTRESALQQERNGPVETIRITNADLEAERARYSNATSDRVDVVAVGCPHASLAQVREVADLVDSAHIHPDTLFVVQTSAAIAAQAEKEGLAQRLAAAGVELTADTCVHIAFREPPPGATLATNALKIAYLTASHDVAVRFGSLRQCVEAAIAGRWSI